MEDTVKGPVGLQQRGHGKQCSIRFGRAAASDACIPVTEEARSAVALYAEGRSA